MPGIDYTLTKPVDYSAAVDQVINWGANKRQRAIQKQEQEAILGGELMRSEAKVGANGSVTSGFADPMEMQLKRNLDAAKAASYGDMAAYRAAQIELGKGRLGVSQGNLTARQEKDRWNQTPQTYDDGTTVQPTPGGGQIFRSPQGDPTVPDLPSAEPQPGSAAYGNTPPADDEFDYFTPDDFE